MQRQKIEDAEGDWCCKEDIIEKMGQFYSDKNDTFLLSNSKFIMEGLRKMNEKLTFTELEIYNNIGTDLIIDYPLKPIQTNNNEEGGSSQPQTQGNNVETEGSMGNNSIEVGNKGKIYSWGFGSNGQLGLGFCEDYYEPGEGLIKSRIFEPQLIHTFKDYNSAYKGININYATMKIKEIKCGKTFSMFINTNNDLFACGINDLRQLGFKDLEKKDKINNFRLQCDDYIYPSLLNCFNHRKVEKISCGEGHCLAVIKYINSNIQSIWSWGNNKYGQIGHGLMVKISLPKEVEYLSEYNMNYFSDVSCGGFHSLILLKSKNNLDWN